jgi:hypothetical protein
LRAEGIQTGHQIAAFDGVIFASASKMPRLKASCQLSSSCAGFSPRLYRRKALGNQFPQPEQRVFIAGLALRPDIAQSTEENRPPDAAAARISLPSAACGDVEAEHPASARQAMPESSHPRATAGKKWDILTR